MQQLAHMILIRICITYKYFACIIFIHNALYIEICPICLFDFHKVDSRELNLFLKYLILF